MAKIAIAIIVTIGVRNRVINLSLEILVNHSMDDLHGLTNANSAAVGMRQQRRRCFLSLHFLFKDMTQYQQ